MHIYILDPKLLHAVEFSSNLSEIYTKWCAQTIPPIFGLFAIYDRNFAKIVEPPSEENENYVVRLKEQSIQKKTLKTSSKSTYKWQRNACWIYAPLERTVLRTRSVTKKKHHIFAPTAGARRTIFPKLCMVIEHVETIKKVGIIFDPTHSFSYEFTEKFGLINRRAVSQQ